MKNNLKQLREAKGWSQTILGEKLGIAHNSVSGYENGKTFLSRRMIENFANALEVAIEDIEVQEDVDGLDVERNRPATVALDLLPTSILKDMERALADRLPNTHGNEKEKTLDSLTALTKELNRRDSEDPNLIHAAQLSDGPIGQNGQPVSPEVEQAARRMLKDAIKHILSTGEKPKREK